MPDFYEEHQRKEIRKRRYPLEAARKRLKSSRMNVSIVAQSRLRICDNQMKGEVATALKSAGLLSPYVDQFQEPGSDEPL